MKLATYRDGSRDGQLVVVSRDLSAAHYATAIAKRLQQALDDWGFVAPQLEDLYATLNQGKARQAFAFEPAKCLAPLPRAFGLSWSGSAAPAWRPCFDLGRAAASVVCPACEIGVEVGFAALLGDVAEGTPAEAGLDGVRLLTICADLAQYPAADGAVSLALANLFGPVTVTPDELGPDWQRGRIAPGLALARNGAPVALADGAGDAPAHIGELVAALSRRGRLRAGVIAGLGVPARDRWQPGDRLRLTSPDADGSDAFGAIDAALTRTKM
jgi:fumarylacetoacetate (FAA) hydrolase